MCGLADFSLPFAITGHENVYLADADEITGENAVTFVEAPTTKCTSYDDDRGTADQLACPATTYLNFTLRCTACPSGGCTTDLETTALCGANTHFVVAHSKLPEALRCDCGLNNQSTKTKMKITPDYSGCVESCDLSTNKTMTMGRVFEDEDACICRGESEVKEGQQLEPTPAYSSGDAICYEGCGAKPFMYNRGEEKRDVQDNLKRRTCIDTCSGDDVIAGKCHCEKGYALTLSGKCTKCTNIVDGICQDAATTICGANTVLANNLCGCVADYVVAVDGTRCVSKDDCIGDKTILNAKPAEATRCIYMTECAAPRAVSLGRNYCVPYDESSKAICGSNAEAEGSQCVCKNRDHYIQTDASGCISSCDVKNAFVNGTTRKQCFNDGECTGKCRCQKGWVLQLDGTCTNPATATSGRLGAGECTVGKLQTTSDGYQICTCAYEGFGYVNEEKTQCVNSCPADSAYVNKMNDERFCQTGCLRTDRCVCDFYNGQYNLNGTCTQCADNYITYERTCAAEAVCGSDEVAYGRHCIKTAECTEEGRFIDISTKNCVDSCGKNENLSGTSCVCTKKGYKKSKDGFSCVKKGLPVGAIIGIVAGAVALVVIIVVVIVVVKKGKSKKASKAAMNDTVTGNNDTALASAGAK